MKTTTIKPNQIILTLSDSQLKQLTKIEKIITRPRIVDFEYLCIKLNTEGMTKEQIISAILNKALADLNLLHIADRPTLRKLPDWTTN